MNLNAEDIKTTYWKYFEKEAANGNERLKIPLKTIRASSIGKCATEYYFRMVEPWEGVGWYTPENVMKMKDGQRHEQWMVMDLINMGYDIIDQQKPIDNHPELRKRNISGHIEFQINENGKLKPCEIKSMTTYTETGINGLKDFDNFWYYRHYPDQVQIYLFGLNAQEMTYFVKNKDSSKPNMFDIKLDMDRVKKNLDKADLINSCVKAKEPPPRQPWCEECAGCSFLQHCLPDIKGDGGLISIEQPEASVIELLERKGELSEAHKEHERLNKLLKDYWKTRLGDEDFKLIIMGDWKFEIKRVNRKGFEVKPSSYASAKVENIGGES